MALHIAIGTEPRAALPQLVLEHSILRRTKQAVEFHPLNADFAYDARGIPLGTGFSLRRWFIAHRFRGLDLCAYLDADQLVLADVEELFAEAEGDFAFWTSVVGGVANSAVSVFDCRRCAAFPWTADAITAKLRGGTKAAYRAFMRDGGQPQARGDISGDWNSLDAYVPGRTKLVHMTNESRQPWRFTGHPLLGLWEAELRSALKAGYVAKTLVREQLRLWKRPGSRLDGHGRRTQDGIHPYWKRVLA